MARVVCVDMNAEKRQELKALLEDAHRESRQSTGYLEPSQYVSCSKEQVIVSSPPDVIVIGPGFSVEDAHITCKDINGIHPKVPIAVILDPANYSLRSIRRLEKHARLILLSDDKPMRIVHELGSLHHAKSTDPQGKLITCIGVKGGVGTTSVVGGLAHAAEAVGMSAVVVDLSPQSVFPFYMGTTTWQSPEYRSLLMDRIQPDKTIVRKMVTTAPNGINLLLPPSGGLDVREQWLRNEECFEISLSIMDYLREDFDLVLVDIGCVEGVLTFALNSNASARLVVSSNDPASVHLLRNALVSLSEIPGSAGSSVILNEINQYGIDTKDIRYFLDEQDELLGTNTQCYALALDPRAGAWIGTKNSFYTEARSATRAVLEQVVVGLSGQVHNPVLSDKTRPSSLLGLLSRLVRREPEEKSQIPRVALPPLEMRSDEGLGQPFHKAEVRSVGSMEEPFRLFESAKVINE
ncbi:MAG: AAA family ATPase [Deltaproteobacteria bacterium]|nr:AAA family ATPase [Deltaproteobacteria bacterium]